MVIIGNTPIFETIHFELLKSIWMHTNRLLSQNVMVWHIIIQYRHLISYYSINVVCICSCCIPTTLIYDIVIPTKMHLIGWYMKYNDRVHLRWDFAHQCSCATSDGSHNDCNIIRVNFKQQSDISCDRWS